VQAHSGWKVERLLFDGGRSGICSLQRSSGRLSVAPVHYLPRGPAAAAEQRSAIIQVLLERARAEAAALLRIEPNEASGAGFEEELLAAGFTPADSIQPAATQLLDIRPDLKTLLAGMKPKTRYNLSLAERKGVTVSSFDDTAAFARLCAETSRRQQVTLPPESHYQLVLRCFGDRARMYLASYQGEPLSAIMVLRFGTTAYYMYGGSTTRHRETMASYLVHWVAIQEMRSAGCDTYDWWGVPAEPSPDHPWFGLYRFKTGFGGKTVRYTGLHERVLRPMVWNWELRLNKLKRRLRPSILG
jgi:lipid II:glycine glycyltransferase (peptidoglycan interpeptide bridge formation enzyme)